VALLMGIKILHANMYLNSVSTCITCPEDEQYQIHHGSLTFKLQMILLALQFGMDEN
jgi:hypothetical protein